MRMFDNLRRGRRKSIAPASFRSEQQRHIREHLSEEELTLFDILLKPAPELSEAERRKVKAVARELLEQVKALLVLNWRAKAASRAQLKLAIEDALDLGLPKAYTPELYQQKCNAIFEHFYVRYPERESNVYTDTSPLSSQ